MQRLPALTTGLALLLGTTLTGCSGSDSDPDGTTVSQNTPTSAPTSAPSSQPDGRPLRPITDTTPIIDTTPPPDNRVANFVGLTAPKPATWTWSPPRNQMRKANWTVPGEEGADMGEVVVSYFERNQGTVEMNIDRWKSQFRGADGGPPESSVETIEADGMTVTVLELIGEHRKMGNAWFTADQMALSAIVEAPIGQVYIRMTGPQVTVERNRDDFMTMIRELKRTDED